MYVMPHTRDWNAASYARTAAPVEAFGHRLLEGLRLRGDETVLDAGCGIGRVTEELIARVPRGRVIGVDGSPAMIGCARERLGRRAEFRVADLVELELEAPVDVVFSSATFHPLLLPGLTSIGVLARSTLPWLKLAFASV